MPEGDAESISQGSTEPRPTSQGRRQKAEGGIRFILSVLSKAGSTESRLTGGNFLKVLSADFGPRISFFKA